MKIDLTLREVKTLMAAIESAIQNEDSYIDSHNCGWKKGKSCVPDEYKPVVRRAKLFIDRMKKVRKKLALGVGAPKKNTESQDD